MLLVNEAYTSKTCSWNGEIVAKLGGQRWIQSSDGFRVERDINGARGIFLRALGDTPSLMQSACIATGVVNVGQRKSIGRLIVINDQEIPDDLVRDMTEILTCFCARLYGKRSAANRAAKALQASQQQDDAQKAQ